MDYSKMSMDKLRELIAWADDRAAYRRACGTISGTAYAEDETAVRAATRRNQPPRTGDRIRKRRNTK